MKKLRGGLDTVIVVVIIIGLVVALLWSVFVPMAIKGDALIDTTTDRLATQQSTMQPK